MSDLISRQSLINSLKENLDDCDIQKSLEFFGIYDFIEDQPTAYDVEKVVEQLEEAMEDTTDTDTGIGASWAYKGAIKIVKAGGVNG